MNVEAFSVEEIVSISNLLENSAGNRLVVIFDELFKGTPNVQFSYMPTVMSGAVPAYTYRLAQGISADKQEMIIIEQEGILQLLHGANE